MVSDNSEGSDVIELTPHFYLAANSKDVLFSLMPLPQHSDTQYTFYEAVRLLEETTVSGVKVLGCLSEGDIPEDCISGMNNTSTLYEYVDTRSYALPKGSILLYDEKAGWHGFTPFEEFRQKLLRSEFFVDANGVKIATSNPGSVISSIRNADLMRHYVDKWDNAEQKQAHLADIASLENYELI